MFCISLFLIISGYPAYAGYGLGYRGYGLGYGGYGLGGLGYYG